MSEKAISKGLTKGRLTNRIINDTNARLKIDGAKVIIIELKFTISDGNRTTITKPFDLVIMKRWDDQPSSCVQQHVRNFGLCSFLSQHTDIAEKEKASRDLLLSSIQRTPKNWATGLLM